MKRIVAITGGIGSGKSVVSRLLQVMGYAVYDADGRARELMERSAVIRSGLTALAGPDIYGTQGLDRIRLSRLIFGDRSLLQAVDALVHPVVRDDFRLWCEERPEGLLFIESAILFESGFRPWVDSVWFVQAPEALRVDRVMRRSGLSSEAVRARMAAQMDDDRKEALSDVVIRNDGAIPLMPQVLRLLAREEAGTEFRSSGPEKEKGALPD